MIYAFVLSFILHVLILLLTITCNSFFYVNCPILDYKKDNQKSITLLSLKDIIVKDTVLKKQSSAKGTCIVQPQLSSTSKAQSKIKSLKKFNKSQKFTDDLTKINTDNIINTPNHLSSDDNKNKSISDINNTMCNSQKRFWPIQYIHPEYPNSAKALGIEGKLYVMYNINEIGKVEKIRILSANPIRVFEENVKFAMRRWVYEKENPQQDLTIIFKFSSNIIQLSND